MHRYFVEDVAKGHPKRSWSMDSMPLLPRQWSIESACITKATSNLYQPLKICSFFWPKFVYFFVHTSVYCNSVSELYYSSELISESRRPKMKKERESAKDFKAKNNVPVLNDWWIHTYERCMLPFGFDFSISLIHLFLAYHLLFPRDGSLILLCHSCPHIHSLTLYH